MATGSVNLGQGFPDTDRPTRGAGCCNRGDQRRHQPVPARARHGGVARGDRRIISSGSTGCSTTPTRRCSSPPARPRRWPASLMGLLDTGDEVVLFEPMYDSYQACIALAGAVAKPVTLRPAAVQLRSRRVARRDHTEDQAAADQHARTTPPVMCSSADELQLIADLAIEHDLLVITDEVYEHLVFDDARHVPMATLAGHARPHAGDLQRRQDVQHDRMEDRLDLRAAAAHRRGTHREAVPDLRQRRAVPTGDRRRASACPTRSSPSSPPTCRPSATGCCRACTPPGSTCIRPHGTYFVTVDIRPMQPDGDGMAFCRAAARRCGVVGDPQRGVLRQPARGPAPRAVRVLQAPRGARRGRRAARQTGHADNLRPCASPRSNTTSSGAIARPTSPTSRR